MVPEVVVYRQQSAVSEAWMKNALLFWDRIRLVSPLVTAERPYDMTRHRFLLLSDPRASVFEFGEGKDDVDIDHPVSRAMVAKGAEVMHLKEIPELPTDDSTVGRLLQMGIIEPLYLNANSADVNVVSQEMLSTLQTEEGVRYMDLAEVKKAALLLRKDLRETIMDIAQFFPDEVPDKLFVPLDYQRQGNQSNYWDTKNWVELNREFLRRYYARLVTSISSRLRLPVLSGRDAEHLDVSYVLQDRIGTDTVYGAMFNLSVNSVTLDPATDIDQLLLFKEKYKDELFKYRRALKNLTNGVNVEGHTVDSLLRELKVLHAEEVERGQRDLKRAMKGLGINTIQDGVLKVATLSTTAGTLASQLLSTLAPQSALVAAGLSIAASAVKYARDRASLLREQPYSYLLRIQRELT